MAASEEWARTASKLRFGPEAKILESNGSFVVYLGEKVLGMGNTWEGALQDAHEHNRDLPQPSPDVFMKNPLPAEEYVEEFCQTMRQRDLFSEFLLWYGEKGDQDRESYPRVLTRKEWLETFAGFVEGLK